MELIDKATLVAEIEKRKKDWKYGNSTEAKYKREECVDILSFLDTLEVKEVDLDFQRFAKEMDVIFALPSLETKNTEENPLNWEFAIAKHFFQLGLKAKGEIYVVTRSEEHADYVEAVFLNEDKAEEYCKPFNEDEDSYARNITKIKISE